MESQHRMTKYFSEQLCLCVMTRLGGFSPSGFWTLILISLVLFSSSKVSNLVKKACACVSVYKDREDIHVLYSGVGVKIPLGSSSTKSDSFVLTFSVICPKSSSAGVPYRKAGEAASWLSDCNKVSQLGRPAAESSDTEYCT